MDQNDIVSNDIITFLEEFSHVIQNNELSQVVEFYLTKWEEFTKENYRTTPWPSVASIQGKLGLKGNFKELFLCLYRERYYRHIFTKLILKNFQNNIHKYMKDYMDSFQNFVNLFNLFIKIWKDEEKNMLYHLELPNIWLWDLIHNFVEQCQTFHLWKSSLKTSERDLIVAQNMLLENNVETCWSLQSVFRYLSLFVFFAGIPIRLGLDSKEHKKNEMQIILGQFSVIGLLRLHTLLGDYTTALECLENLNLRTINALTMSWTCDLTIFYHQAVCYMMKGRFLDALDIIYEVMGKYGTIYEFESTNELVSNRFQLWFQRLKNVLPICKFLSFQSEGDTDINVFPSSKEWIMNLYDRNRPDFIPTSGHKSNKLKNYNSVSDAQRIAFSLLIDPHFSLKDIHSTLKIYRSINLTQLKSDVGSDNILVKLLKQKLHTRQIQKRVDDLPHQGIWKNTESYNFFIQDNFIKCYEVEIRPNHAEDISKLIRNTSVLKFM